MVQKERLIPDLNDQDQRGPNTGAPFFYDFPKWHLAQLKGSVRVGLFLPYLRSESQYFLHLSDSA